MRRGDEVTLDVRDHKISIQEIGNQPDDPEADEQLVTELTTPAPTMIGTCSTTFGGHS